MRMRMHIYIDITYITNIYIHTTAMCKWYVLVHLQIYYTHIYMSGKPYVHVGVHQFDLTSLFLESDYGWQGA